MKPPRTYILARFVRIICVARYCVQRIVRKLKLNIVRGKQRFVLLGYGMLRLVQYALIVLHRKRIKVYLNREPALKFRNKIGYFGHMERARRNEEHKVRFYWAVFRIHRAAFNYRQNIPLHAFARNIRPACAVVSGYFVDLVYKHYAVLLGLLYGLAYDLVHVYKLFGFLLRKYAPGLAHLNAALFLILGYKSAHHFVKVYVYAHGKHDVAAGVLLLHLNLYKLVFKQSV